MGKDLSIFPMRSSSSENHYIHPYQEQCRFERFIKYPGQMVIPERKVEEAPLPYVLDST
jgi:hypothetical protein